MFFVGKKYGVQKTKVDQRDQIRCRAIGNRYVELVLRTLLKSFFLVVVVVIKKCDQCVERNRNGQHLFSSTFDMLGTSLTLEQR